MAFDVMLRPQSQSVSADLSLVGEAEDGDEAHGRSVGRCASVTERGMPKVQPRSSLSYIHCNSSPTEECR